MWEFADADLLATTDEGDSHLAGAAIVPPLLLPLLALYGGTNPLVHLRCLEGSPGWLQRTSGASPRGVLGYQDDTRGHQKTIQEALVAIKMITESAGISLLPPEVLLLSL